MNLARFVTAASMGCAALAPSAAELVGSTLRPHTEDAARWGTPSLVVKPQYPKTALESRQNGIVEVEGVLDGTGALTQIVYRPVSAAAEIFVPALQRVAPHWLFHVPLGSDCLPQAQKVTTRVEFAIDGAQPRIYMSYAKAQAVARSERPDHLKPIHQRPAEYPRQMRTANQEARVYARLDIAATGDVSRVTAVAYPRPGSQKVVPAVFEDEARRALLRWQFPPAPAGWSGERAVCQTVLFQMRD